MAVNSSSSTKSTSSIPKRKSPLFNKPQNYYAPPSSVTASSMTRDEISAWRKEQRHQRNRESAANSRNKTRSRIVELNAEVDSYKRLYEEMRGKMASMERHMQFLTKFRLGQQQQQKEQEGQMSMRGNCRTMVSQPSNPASSRPEPTLSLFDPMESAPYHPPLSQAETQGHSPAASSALRPSAVPYLSLSNTAITELLLPSTFSQTNDHTRLVEEQKPLVSNSLEGNRMGKEDGSIVKCGANTVDKSVSVASVNDPERDASRGIHVGDHSGGGHSGMTDNDNGSALESSASNSSVDDNDDEDYLDLLVPISESNSNVDDNDDEDYLDLLVDSLEGEFDPNLFDFGV